LSVRPSVRLSVCPRVVNPSTGLGGVGEASFFVCVCVSVSVCPIRFHACARLSRLAASLRTAGTVCLERSTYLSFVFCLRTREHDRPLPWYCVNRTYYILIYTRIQNLPLSILRAQSSCVRARQQVCVRTLNPSL
jgi:hypothetical protein